MSSRNLLSRTMDRVRNLRTLLTIGLATVYVATLPCLTPAQVGGERLPSAKSEQSASGAVNLGRSRVYIYVGKRGRLGHDHGVMGRLKSGQVKLDATKDAGELVFDMTSFVADTAEARRYVGLSGEKDAGTRQEVTRTMLGSAVLDSGRYPTARFAITSAKRIREKTAQSSPQYQLDGVFTLHGVARPLSLVALVEEYEGEQRLRGSFVIQQTDYGIRPISKAFGAMGVANELKIWGDLLLNP